MSEHGTAGGDIRAQIPAAIAHLEHVLPGQAPIRDFVHHNTLHGLQHKPFREAIGEAIGEARRITGTRGFLPLERFRAYYAEGRIAQADLEAVLAEAPDLGAGEPLAPGLEDLDPPLKRGDLYRVALLHPIGPITAARLNWQIDEMGALQAFQPEVPAVARQRVLTRAGAQTGGQPEAGDEAGAVADLWAACLGVLGLEQFSLHPEDLVDLSPEQAEQMPAAAARRSRGQAAAGGGDQPQTERQIRIEAAARLQTLLDRVGADLTLRGLLRLLTGEDLMDQIRPQMVRHLATSLDEGLAAWRNPRLDQGLYQAWRLAARSDLTPVFRGLDAWGTEVDAIPADPIEAIIAELKRLGLTRERWVPYLERLALELPGWSGMTLWRNFHPGYDPQGRGSPGKRHDSRDGGGRAASRTAAEEPDRDRGYTTPVSMLDYLALRLVLERIHAQRLCRSHWQIEASLDMLRWYFRRNPEELLVRHALYSDRLPEYLATRAARAAAHSDLDRGDPGWTRLAALLWTWRQARDSSSATVADAALPPLSLESCAPGGHGPAGDQGAEGQGPSVLCSAWPLFHGR